MSYWEKNMDALRVRDEDFYHKIMECKEKQQDEAGDSYVVEQARDGTDCIQGAGED